jgi:hypothetical protein
LAACYCIGGWIWWRGSYQELDRSGFRVETVPLLALVTLFLTWFVGTRALRASLVTTGAFVAVVITRIALDFSRDPTSHNLFPFEVGFAVVTGMLMTLPFAGLGRLLRHFTHRASAASGAD